MGVKKSILVGTIILLAGASARADELTAQEIVDKALEHNAFGLDNTVAMLTLVLTSKRGTKRERKIEIWSLERNALNKTLVRFHAPADVAGTGFLVIENDDRDDDQYLYLPALGKVKRITGSQRNQRFMGTDLTYADMESRNLDESTSIRLPDEKVGGNMAYVVESTPKDKKDSQYGKTVSWLHQVSFMPLKVEFYDKRMKLLKVLTVRRLEKRDGAWVVMDSSIKNVQAKTQTDMTVNELHTKAKLSDDDFTQRALTGG